MREGACDVLQQFVGCRDDSDATMCEGVYHRPRAVDSANALERSEQKGVRLCRDCRSLAPRGLVGAVL